MSCETEEIEKVDLASTAQPASAYKIQVNGKVKESRIATSAPTTTLQASSTGLRCEELMHKCIDGDYAQLPEFAVKVWEWFAETPCANDPSTTARNVGQKAALLLFSMNAKFNAEAKTIKESPPDSARTMMSKNILVELLSFFAGYFIHGTYGWAICTAWISMRMLSAIKFFKTIRNACPLTEIMAFGHSYYVLDQSLTMSLFNAAAWYIVWNQAAIRMNY